MTSFSGLVILTILSSCFCVSSAIFPRPAAGLYPTFADALKKQNATRSKVPLALPTSVTSKKCNVIRRVTSFENVSMPFLCHAASKRMMPVERHTNMSQLLIHTGMKMNGWFPCQKQMTVPQYKFQRIPACCPGTMPMPNGGCMVQRTGQAGRALNNMQLLQTSGNRPVLGKAQPNIPLMIRRPRPYRGLLDARPLKQLARSFSRLSKMPRTQGRSIPTRKMGFKFPRFEVGSQRPLSQFSRTPSIFPLFPAMLKKHQQPGLQSRHGTSQRRPKGSTIGQTVNPVKSLLNAPPGKKPLSKLNPAKAVPTFAKAGPSLGSLASSPLFNLSPFNNLYGSHPKPTLRRSGPMFNLPISSPLFKPRFRTPLSKSVPFLGPLMNLRPSNPLSSLSGAGLFPQTQLIAPLAKLPLAGPLSVFHRWMLSALPRKAIPFSSSDLLRYFVDFLSPPDRPRNDLLSNTNLNDLFSNANHRGPNSTANPLGFRFDGLLKDLFSNTSLKSLLTDNNFQDFLKKADRISNAFLEGLFSNTDFNRLFPDTRHRGLHPNVRPGCLHPKGRPGSFNPNLGPGGFNSQGRPRGLHPYHRPGGLNPKGRPTGHLPYRRTGGLIPNIPIGGLLSNTRPKDLLPANFSELLSNAIRQNLRPNIGMNKPLLNANLSNILSSVLSGGPLFNPRRRPLALPIGGLLSNLRPKGPVFHNTNPLLPNLRLPTGSGLLSPSAINGMSAWLQNTTRHLANVLNNNLQVDQQQHMDQAERQNQLRQQMDAFLTQQLKLLQQHSQLSHQQSQQSQQPREPQQQLNQSQQQQEEERQQQQEEQQRPKQEQEENQQEDGGSNTQQTDSTQTTSAGPRFVSSPSIMDHPTTINMEGPTTTTPTTTMTLTEEEDAEVGGGDGFPWTEGILDSMPHLGQPSSSGDLPQMFGNAPASIPQEMSEMKEKAGKVITDCLAQSNISLSIHQISHSTDPGIFKPICGATATIGPCIVSLAQQELSQHEIHGIRGRHMVQSVLLVLGRMCALLDELDQLKSGQTTEEALSSTPSPSTTVADSTTVSPDMTTTMNTDSSSSPEGTQATDVKTEKTDIIIDDTMDMETIKNPAPETSTDALIPEAKIRDATQAPSIMKKEVTEASIPMWVVLVVIGACVLFLIIGCTAVILFVRRRRTDKVTFIERQSEILPGDLGDAHYAAKTTDPLDGQEFKIPEDSADVNKGGAGPEAAKRSPITV